MKANLSGPVSALILMASCAHHPLAARSSLPRVPASHARLATLPDPENKWASLYTYADNLDLTDPAIHLSLSTGGTSIYGVINVGTGTNKRAIGAIIPENSSASVSGETVAFTISRALGISEIFQPAVYHFLSGANLTAFMTIVPKEPVLKNGVVQTNKEENRLAILKRFEAQPHGMDAVFKQWDEKPKSYDAINGEDRHINPTHVLSGSQAPLASMLLCDGPKASPDVTVTFNDGTNDELSVAKEVSSILLVDALTQQWDRFSGGNLQTILRGGHSMFVSIDNGGTWGGTRATELNLSMVTRFDREVAEKINAMDDFFTHGQPYLGLTTEAEFASAFDIAQDPKILQKLKTSLRLVAAHLRAHSGCFF